MLEVFRHADSALVSLRQSVLEDAGIATYIRNAVSQQSLVESLAVAIAPLPMFYPTLCVVNDEDYAAARELLADPDEGATMVLAPEWRCPHCAEPVPGNFDTCWKCQTPRPG